jgi:glycosyltransferase involved in cell wall biosynthesis
VKRVLILIKGLGRGGAEQLLAAAAPHVDRGRFSYEVAYLLPGKDALVPELRDAGLPVHCLGANGVGWTTRLRTLVRRRRFHIVHVHSPYPAAVARAAFWRERELKVVYTEHGMWWRQHPTTYWANVLTFPRNDHVFAVSESVRQSIGYPGGLGHRRMPPVEVLYHGIDLRSVTARATPDGVRRELGISEGAPTVGMVANFRELKGHRYLLQAAAQVRRKVPEARFVLVGRGPLEERVRDEASRLGLDGTVVFAGFRDDVPRILAALDIFTLPSVHEGLSIALLEAMALGLPSVVTDVGGNPEVIHTGKEGLIVPPRDAGALADALASLIADPDARRRLGEAAALRAERFDIRTAVRRMEAVYETVTR